MNQPKQPPHAIEAEQSVLGGLLLNNGLWHDLADKLTAADFYRADHQALYAAISEMIGAGKPCDFVTLTEHLRHRGPLEVEPAYIASLAVDTYSINNVLAYATIVRERAVLRGLIAAGSDIGDLGYRPEGRTTEELVEQAEQQVFALRDRARSGLETYRPAESLLPAWIDQLEARRRSGKAFAGIPTGFEQLDRKLAGLQPGRLYVLAARPSIGKTALALNIAAHAAGLGHQTSFFSAEMTADELLDRLVSSWARVPSDRFRFPSQLEDADLDRVSSATSHHALANLAIDDQASMKPGAIRARARRAARKATLGLIVVDYLQLLFDRRRDENRHLELSRIAADFKNLAKELRAPVLLLSQLNRGSEQRTETRPRLSDLRDSGGIEEHADAVLLLHRERRDDGSLSETADLDIGKNRGGPTGRVYLEFLADISTFAPAAPGASHPTPSTPPAKPRGMPDA